MLFEYQTDLLYDFDSAGFVSVSTFEVYQTKIPVARHEVQLNLARVSSRVGTDLTSKVDEKSKAFKK